MSATQPFGYAQGREPLERQMVFDGELGSLSRSHVGKRV